MDDLKLTLTVFATVLFAEMGDKTQLATLLFSADGSVGRWRIFVAASLALILATAIGVIGGAWVSRLVPAQSLQQIAGVGFVLIGFWTLWSSR
ncbi:TMEM165/GDT1 family protein [bacterium]|nr:TMEM165/GDT1 family protein [bacterium]